MLSIRYQYFSLLVMQKKEVNSNIFIKIANVVRDLSLLLQHTCVIIGHMYWCLAGRQVAVVTTTITPHSHRIVA